MRTLVLASANRNKVREISAMLPPGWQLITMEEAGYREDIPETAETIRGNSLLKALALHSFLRGKGEEGWVIADDSGLEVKALSGAPGVRSARYAGAEANDAANLRKLLAELAHHTDRRARFVTVITLIAGNDQYFFEGEAQGTIAFEPRGANGFGYDPVFVPTGYRSTFAELPPEEKNRISHRAKAVARLFEWLSAHS